MCYQMDLMFLTFIKIASVFHRNCVKKLHRSKVDFSSIEIKSEKVDQTGIDIFTIKIVS